MAGQTYEQLPHITHSIPSNLVKPSSSLRDAKPASFAGRRCSGHASPHLPHLIHAEDVVLDTISFWNTRSDELPLTTGRAINSSMLPADAGCIVHNVDTIFSIYLSVIEGKPLTKRICTVTGDGVKEPGNFYVWLGTNYRQLLDAAGGPVGEPEKYISGGPMMGFAMYSLDVPVVKGSSSLLVFQ